MDLNQIVETEPEKLRKWATFKEGFDVEIEYVSRESLEALRRKCMKVKYRNHQRIEELDEQLFYAELAKKITAWRGLTVEVLRTMLPVKQDAALNGQQIECTESNKLVLLRKAYGFDDFIFNALTDLQGVSREQTEAELKNSNALSPAG